MPIARAPVEDQWYRQRDKGLSFQVIFVDRDDGIVEMQHFDGDVEEMDLVDWYGLDIEPISPPEDWTGPMDDIERDDLGYSETSVKKKAWDGSTPLGEWNLTEVGNEAI